MFYLKKNTFLIFFKFTLKVVVAVLTPFKITYFFIKLFYPMFVYIFFIIWKKRKLFYWIFHETVACVIFYFYVGIFFLNCLFWFFICTQPPPPLPLFDKDQPTSIGGNCCNFEMFSVMFFVCINFFRAIILILFVFWVCNFVGGELLTS